MKRILTVLALALVMAAVLLVMAMPAFAAKTPPNTGNCGQGETFTTFPSGTDPTAGKPHCKVKADPDPA